MDIKNMFVEYLARFNSEYCHGATKTFGTWVVGASVTFVVVMLVTLFVLRKRRKEFTAPHGLLAVTLTGLWMFFVPILIGMGVFAAFVYAMNRATKRMNRTPSEMETLKARLAAAERENEELQEQLQKKVSGGL